MFEARLRAWLASFDESKARAIKQDGHVGVFSAEFESRKIIVKRWRVRSLGDRLKLWTRTSRADRHRRGAERLMSLGVGTARMLASVTSVDARGPRQLIAMEHLQGPSLLRLMHDRTLSPKQEHALARALAQDMSKMLRAGFYNRDHKPSNLIVTSIDPPSVSVIDTVAIERCGDEGAIRMLASLVIEPIGTGCKPRRAIMMRVVRALGDTALGRPSTQLWMYAQKVVENHGDPRPKVDPLA
jgi:tRNA A-37 threonylcarbamoyl transferase component Bud32